MSLWQYLWSKLDGREGGICSKRSRMEKVFNLCSYDVEQHLIRYWKKYKLPSRT